MIGLVIGSFIVAFILNVMPMSGDWQWCRPEFIAILTFYWSIHASQQFGLISAWCVGFCQDLLEMGSLGVNALSLLLVAYVVRLVYQRIGNYPVWHQAMWIFVLVGMFQLMVIWLDGLLGSGLFSSAFLIGALLSAILWPPLLFLMGRLRTLLRLA